MNKTRIEAFSDAVIAIIITIMVLEMKVPHAPNWQSLLGLWPVLISYVLSFIYLGIYWNNHHHLFQSVEKISGSILWYNLNLLFWLSLIPFVTGWMGENNFAMLPVLLYGIILLFAGFAYYLLSHSLVKQHGPDSILGKAICCDTKSIYSLGLYSAAIAICFYSKWISLAIYIIVGIMWIVPDRRIENVIHKNHS